LDVLLFFFFRFQNSKVRELRVLPRQKSYRFHIFVTEGWEFEDTNVWRSHEQTRWCYKLFLH
jgi:hypothetical protein